MTAPLHTRKGALEELARWQVTRERRDGFMRKLTFQPKGFDIDVAAIEAKRSDYGVLCVERLLRALETLVENPLPRPRKRR